MTVYVSSCIIGVFAIDENDKIIAYRLFEKNAEKIAQSLQNIDGCKELYEIIISELKSKGVKKIETTEPNKATEFLKNNFRKLAVELGFVKDQAELNKLLTEVNLAKTKTQIASMEMRDKLIIQAVSALSDLDKILNVMSERLREWYGFHYPEFQPASHEKFVEAIAKYGKREAFEDFEKSMGMFLSEEDIKILQIYAQQLKQLYGLRKDIEKYLEFVVPQEMPNLNTLLGALLAARLLAQAGSLEKLAKIPSSTIQLLGSEKALFRFLKDKKGKARVPKHGIIFLHPDISSAPREKRGKIARLLASKLTIAARADFYTKEDRSASLVEDYKKHLEQIRKTDKGE